MAGRTLVVVTILISIFKPNNALMYTTSPLSARGVKTADFEQTEWWNGSRNHPPPLLQKSSQGLLPPPPPPPLKKKTNKQTWEKINLHKGNALLDTNPGTPETLTVDRIF